MTRLPGRLALLALLGPLTALAMACASTDEVDEPGGKDPSTDPQGEGESAICLLHNCSADEHCGGCDEGRNTCLVEEGRCVACNAATGTGCEEGMYCSSWGNCVPDGVTCPTDNHGTPQITCTTNADCAACDPMHQVCDPATQACVACTDADTSECASDDICIAGKCEDKCPSACDTDNDCAACGTANAPAKACHAHKCAECSSTYACPAGQVCTPQGTCSGVCGIDNDGSCNSDADCGGCKTGTKCSKPINGGVGQCGPAANGCSDLGNGVAVLPAPFDQVTNTCSNNGDCAGVGIQLNVGKMLRDLTGFDEINDANIDYGMNSCASVSVAGLSCGVCVPCQVDSDCQDIDINQVAAQAFGPLGSLAAAFLMDQIFGQSNPMIHMYCEGVAGGYGVCSPCPGMIYDCSVGGGGGGTGTCDHDVCAVGGPLNGSCSSCAQTVCDVDSFCCNNSWDAQCVSEAASMCGLNCSGGGGGGSTCSHSECSIGSKLTNGCSSCVSAVCAADPYCCNNSWDAQCVSEVDQHCNGMCSGGGGGGGGSSCAHPECTAGAKLSPGCSACAAAVCTADSYCCTNEWDSLCVSKVDQYCSFSC